MKKKSIHHQIKYYIHLIVISILATFTLCSCSMRQSMTPIATTSDLAFDTVISISIYDNSSSNHLEKEQISSVLSECLNMCNEYDTLFSKTNPQSDIYQINHNPGKPQKVDSETMYLIEQSIKYSELTNGKIDITVSKVKDLWDFSATDNNPSLIPDSKQITSAVSHVDYKKIIISKEDQTVTLTDTESEIDLGFIAKGYIADQLKNYMMQSGIENALINLGGNVLAIGCKPDQTPFVVGIEKPFSHSEFMDTIKISDQSVVTSGVYERFFENNGKIYHHIIDPQTGYPAESDLLSATIICNSSLEADALSTSCILLGKDQATKLIKSTDNTSAIFITKDYEMIKIP